MAILWWYKFLRLIHSLSVSFTITAVVSLVGLFANQSPNSLLNVMPHWFWWILLWGSIILLVLNTIFEYNRQTYDPKWALDYQYDFSDSDFIKTRKEAAEIIKSNKENFSSLVGDNKKSGSLDEVLDFFEEVGFYVKGRQISPEVAYHHFYHWLRGYYSLSKPYIALWRDEEKTRWENIEFLFNITYEIERKSNGKTVQEELEIPKKKDFLGEEIGLEIQ